MTFEIGTVTEPNANRAGFVIINKETKVALPIRFNSLEEAHSFLVYYTNDLEGDGATPLHQATAHQLEAAVKLFLRLWLRGI